MKAIPLTKGLMAYVDDDDFSRVLSKRWHALHSHGSYYAAHSYQDVDGKIKSLLMHRFIVCAPSGVQVDHLDGDKLNNCKSNLRICTVSENMFNRTALRGNKAGFKGVFFDQTAKRYRACIKACGKRIYLGYHETPELAAAAYDAAARKFHGQFARLNFP